MERLHRTWPWTQGSSGAQQAADPNLKAAADRLAETLSDVGEEEFASEFEKLRLAGRAAPQGILRLLPREKARDLGALRAWKKLGRLRRS